MWQHTTHESTQRVCILHICTKKAAIWFCVPVRHHTCLGQLNPLRYNLVVAVKMRMRQKNCLNIMSLLATFPRPVVVGCSLLCGQGHYREAHSNGFFPVQDI